MDKNADELKSNGGESSVIPLGYNKSGDFKAKSGVVSEYDMEKLVTFVHNKVGELGQHILDGEIDINPYIKVSSSGGLNNGKTPCAYCEYNDVCGFDGKVSGYEYRKLVKKKDEEVWKLLRQEVYAGEDISEELADEKVKDNLADRNITDENKEIDKGRKKGGENSGELD